MMESKYSGARAKRYGMIDAEYCPPVEPHETEIDRQVRDLLSKQQDTRITLREQLAARKEFVSSSSFVPVTELLSGTLSLTQFELAEGLMGNIQHLKSCGLTDDEVKLQLDCIELSPAEFNQKYAKVSRNALESRLRSIAERIYMKTLELTEKHDLHKNITRHELDLELSLNPLPEKASLIHFLIGQRKSPKRDNHPLTHPINQIKQIESDLNLRLQPQKVIKPVSLHPKPTCEVEPASRFVGPCRPDSLWDIKTSVPLKAWSRQRPQIEPVQPKRQKLYTVQDGQIISVDKVTETHVPKSTAQSTWFVGTSDIRPEACDQLSVEDIRKISHFSNYDPGVPSNVLYVKNLAKHVTESDLVTMFSESEKAGRPTLKYRLLKGRMKGQAFVTFPDISEAEAALKKVNGCIWKGKPIVIEFGKSRYA